MPPDLQLSDLQLLIMKALWEAGEASAAQVHDRLQAERDLAPTTVATMLSRLEKRGLVGHRSEGRQYIYAAQIAEGEVRRSMLSRLTDFFFGGDQSALVSQLVQDENLRPAELEALKQLIASRESNPEGDG